MRFKSLISRRGFTLIEMTMVILLVGILSSVAFVQYIDFSKDGKIAVTKSRLNELRLVIVGDSHQISNGQFLSPGFIAQVGSVPVSLDDLITQGVYPSYDPFLKQGWSGPYISTNEANWRKDAWGQVIQYDSVGRTLTSCGVDQVCGTGDDIVVNF
jgi:prepilin-type N-terminal cleavage/methylation domain-containing protein